MVAPRQPTGYGRWMWHYGGMRAWRMDEYGHYSNLRLVDIPSSPLDEGQVRIRNLAAGVNFADLLMTEGRYQVRPDPPFTPGFECAGEVTESAHPRFAPGDRVFCGLWHGAYAEEVIAPADRTWRIPPGVSPIAAAALYANYMTAACGLLGAARLQPGEWTAVNGATGGVGTSALHVTRAVGAKTLAVVGDPRKTDAAREAGAEAVLLADDPALREQIDEVTAGERLDAVADVVGGPLAELLLRSLRYNGRYLVVGFASGAIPSFRANLVLLKAVRVIGVNLARILEEEPNLFEETLTRLGGWIREGAIVPKITTMPLGELPRALALVEKRRVGGKLVLLP